MQPKTTKAKKPVTKQKKEITFPFDKQNFMIIGAGIAVIIIGYIIMSQNSVDGFLPTVVAPIVLLLGYCVIIPYGILRRSSVESGTTVAADQQLSTVSAASSSSGASVSSNIKTS